MDRIEKTILLNAPLRRVWRAISDSGEFGAWFGVKFDEPFAPGVTMRGKIVGTQVDEEVAKAQKQFEGLPFVIVIDRIESERLFSFRWHPGATDPNVDYSKEPMTLVEFRLEETADGVRLMVTESGFDQIPLSRRAQAFTQNEGGWSKVVELVAEYVRRAQG